MRKFKLPKIKNNECIYVSFKPGMQTSLNVEDGYVDLEELKCSPVYEHIVGIAYNASSDEYELELTEEGVKMWQKKEEEDRAFRAWYYQNYGKID